MKITATIAGKLLIAGIAGWTFGVAITIPFVKKHSSDSTKKVTVQAVYKLVQQNAEWNKKNTVNGLDKIPGCSYVYEDVTHNPYVKCKLPCITLYKNSQILYKWEGNIMMQNDITIQKVQEQMK